MNFSEEWLKEKLKTGHVKISSKNEKARNHHTGKASNLESDISYAIERSNEIKAFSSPVNILIHSYRYRLCDPEGISVKWCLDAIVKAGILQDDSAKEIEEVRFKQTKIEKDEEERTVISIEEFKNNT